MMGYLREPLFDAVPANTRRIGLLAHLHLDAPLLLGLLAASCLGLIALYSAGSGSTALVERQLIRLAVGFGVMAAVAQIPPDKLRLWTPPIFVGGILLLIAVLLFGDVGKGAQRWLDLGFMRFQPSEIMKLSVPMMLAWYLSGRRLPPTLVHVAAAALMTIVPVLLILKQPDLGTALLVASSGGFALFLSGLSWRLIAVALVGAGMAAPAFWKWGMHDYQRQRVLTLLDPESDPLGSGYHIIQSKIAIGSGGAYGKGWLNGTQAHLQFLPESSTDFIFAVYAEEFGLFGGLALLGLYAFIIGRGLIIAVRAQQTYGRLLAGSLSLTFFVYLFVNVGMVIGLLPVVGLPLPLISYGGTSLVTVMAGFGALMSIQTHRKLLSR
jgi:rod shape determining protein RodA